MDEEDELMFNVFYLLLRNEFRRKYECATEKGWTICVPIGSSLKGVSITSAFIDDHILKPTRVSCSHFLSTDEQESHLYKIEKNTIKLVSNDEKLYNDGCLEIFSNPNLAEEQRQSEEDDEQNSTRSHLDESFSSLSDDNVVKILSVEKGFNNQYQPYNIIIIDKPIHFSYRVNTNNHENWLLTTSVDCYEKAKKYLETLEKKDKLKMSIVKNLIARFGKRQYESIVQMRQIVKHTIQAIWTHAIRNQTLERQRDERFQKRLSLSIEIYVLHKLHELIYDKLSEDFDKRNAYLKEKINALIAVGATPDQLGVRECFAISLPYGVVELAMLGATRGPHQRLNCLRNAFEMAFAEIKGAVAESVSKNDVNTDSSDNMSVTPDDLIQICTYLIVKCKCYCLYQDLFYIDNFTFSLNPNDKTAYIVAIYKSALRNLEKINPNHLPTRSDKVKSDIGLKDLMSVFSEENTIPKTPLDREIKNLANLIKKNTLFEDSDVSNTSDEYL